LLLDLFFIKFKAQKLISPTHMILNFLKREA